jgi:hypothetical protein
MAWLEPKAVSLAFQAAQPHRYSSLASAARGETIR